MGQNMLIAGWRVGLMCGLLAVLVGTRAFAQQASPADTSGLKPQASRPSDAAGIEFFEKNIRPLLAEHCYKCHGAKEQEASLRLDRTSSILAGGDRGPAIVPGKADESVLVKAIRYTDQDLQMPPKGKLPQRQIELLIRWIEMGARAPKDRGTDDTPDPSAEFNLAERLEHWAYQPVAEVVPPTVKQSDWPRSSVDRFILSRLEAAGLEPAREADRRTWLRRVAFDLIGLPPTPAELAEFLSDDSAQAYEKVVDRLLASPHYGERWGRHWLDLVRYAETLGHEFDFEIFNAWRYRDYVIRAFNADVPYDRFVIEHLAGDLLADPRRHPRTGTNESIIGTGFFWLGEGKHSPVDVRQEQAEKIDNQIDVLAKTFLAQTVACARCHDHKFDPIPTKDYYSLAGYLKSTRYQQAAIDPPERIAAKAEHLAGLKRQIVSLAADRRAEAWRRPLQDISDYLLAAQAVKHGKLKMEAIAGEFGVQPARLKRWVEALAAKEVNRPEHPLFGWNQLAPLGGASADRLESQRRAVVARLTQQADNAEQSEPRYTELADFAGGGFDDWFVTGQAFGSGASEAGAVLLGASAARPIARFVPAGAAHSGLVSRRLEGALRSGTFIIDQRYLHLQVAGQTSRVNVVIDGFNLIRNPIYGSLHVGVNSDQIAWRTIDLGMWQGHRAYVELIDSVTPDPTQNLPASAADGKAGDGYLVVQSICLSDERASPPSPPDAWNLHWLAGEAVDSLEDLAERFERRLTADVISDGGQTDSPNPAKEAVGVVNWLLEKGLLESQSGESGDSSDVELARLLEEYWRLEASLPAPQRVAAATDGSGEDERVFLRGNYRTLGEVATRGLPVVSRSGDRLTTESDGSGRLELAQGLVDPANPLVARVIVNRIWQHHFGEGIVRTPDDFGRMGQLPTHPRLLDWLARQFVRDSWSMKRMHRELVLSSTYRMSSQSDAATEEQDPENKLWHRIPVRRLEAEIIRDSILALSGRLDPAMYGPSVMPYLTEFMEGRGRPRKSGPLDGDGRRSIYVSVRRNFLTPMFLAFDYPIPFNTIGRRSVSNVPAQALVLMNGPLVVSEARRWAEHVLSETELAPEERVDAMYLAAFARTPSDTEREQALSFVQCQASQHGGGTHDLRAWADLAHVLFNVKEFIFVE